MTDSKSAVRVSVVLPTCNGRKDLEELLPRLLEQEVEGGFEVLVVDSSSTDGSARVCEGVGVSVTGIARSEFRHGATRNLRAADARGEFLVFLTQDSLPREKTFLESLVAPLSEPNVVGAWARVLPRPDDDPLTERTALVQPEAAELGFAVKGDSKWKAASIEERLLRVRFNNVASAARRDFFEGHPFPDVAFGEDLAWALSALDAGRELRFVPRAVVSHAHRYSLSACFERNRVDAAFQRIQFGRLVRHSFGAVLRGLAFEVREDARFILGRRKASAHYLLWSPLLRGAQILGQFFGSRGWNSARGEEATRKIN